MEPSQRPIAYHDAPELYETDPKQLPGVVPGSTKSPMAGQGGSYISGNGLLYPEAVGEPGRREPRTCGLRRSLFWVVLTAAIALVVIAVLAGILGGVASGSIKTAANSLSQQAQTTATVTVTATTGGSATQTGPTSTPSPSTTIISTPSGDVAFECPSADGLNYTAPGTSRVYRRECNANYVFGDGDLGLFTNTTILNMEDCINTCALHADCVGVVFNIEPQCWLKQYLGVRSLASGTESAILWQ